MNRTGEWLCIKREEENIAEAMARISSPEYQNSRESCVMIFW